VKQRSLDRFDHAQKLSGVLRNAIEEHVQLSKEPLCNDWVSRVVPGEGLINVGLRLRPDDEVDHG